MITDSYEVKQVGVKLLRLEHRGMPKFTAPMPPAGYERRVRVCLECAGRILEELDALHRAERAADKEGRPLEAGRLHREWLRRREALDRAYRLAMGRVATRRRRRT